MKRAFIALTIIVAGVVSGAILLPLLDWILAKLEKRRRGK